MIRLPKRSISSPPSVHHFQSPPPIQHGDVQQSGPKDLYIVITSIRTYETALTRLLESFPAEFKKKYIVIFQKEEETDFKVFEDGHIEVSLTSNIYEYAAWTGVSLLQRTGTVPEYSWFLFVHDTSEFFQDSWLYINNIINTYHDTPTDVVWLSPTGQCNICLVRRNAIKYGSAVYKDEYTMTKRDAIEYEWGHVANPNHNKPLCPKCFDTNQQFVQQDAILLGRKNVYGNITREVLYFPSIHFQKYLVPGVIDTGDHPHRP
jgi:hypothetical protein